ncbi:MAG: acetylglutamate kinase [Flavitalea sp.]
METLRVIKIGGNIIDHEENLQDFLHQLAELKGLKILVHGGGKLATRLAGQLQIPQQLVEGRRITDAETLKVITMVYAGFINKNIVAALQSMNCNAIGLCGADGNLVTAKKRTGTDIDYGFVGDVESINVELLKSFLDQQLIPVIAPVTHNGKGQLLNTNADTIAQEIAKSLSKFYNAELVYSFDKAGVLEDTEDDNSLISLLNPELYESLKNSGKIFAGMIPKLDNAFEALKSGVSKVIIGKAENLPGLLNGSSGTSIVL